MPEEIKKDEPKKEEPKKAEPAKVKTTPKEPIVPIRDAKTGAPIDRAPKKK